MNRFFRSALFPLVVIVLLVYLASQTLIPKRGNEAKLTYSELIQEAKAGNVNDVKFNPNRQSISATLASGKKSATSVTRWGATRRPPTSASR